MDLLTDPTTPCAQSLAIVAIAAASSGYLYMQDNELDDQLMSPIAAKFVLMWGGATAALPIIMCGMYPRDSWAKWASLIPLLTMVGVAAFTHTRDRSSASVAFTADPEETGGMFAPMSRAWGVEDDA